MPRNAKFSRSVITQKVATLRRITSRAKFRT